MGGASLRALVAQLIDDGKAYATAEIGVVKAMIGAWTAPAKIAVPLAIVVLFLLNAALTVLIIALGAWLASVIGIAGGLAVAALITLVIAGILVWIAIAQIKKAGK